MMPQCPFELDMPRKLPLHVRRETTRHGRAVYYFRNSPNGKRIRLPDYGQPEFNPAYIAALKGEPAPHAPNRRGTLKWALNEYMLSRHFCDLSESTQRKRLSVFKTMIEKSGHRPLTSIKRADIVAARDARAMIGAGSPANAFLKAVKPFFEHCLEREWIKENPAETVKRVKVKSDGYHTWTLAEVAQFVERHPIGTMAYLALAVLLFTGLRRSDARLAGRQHIRNGVFDFTPGKTKHSSGVRVTFPVLPQLRAAIDAMPVSGLTFLNSTRNVPFKSAASFGNWFRDRCVEAKVPGRAHGLRKAGATIAAENGATAHDLMAIYGWTKISQAETYTKAADRARIGKGAIIKIDVVL